MTFQEVFVPSIKLFKLKNRNFLSLDFKGLENKNHFFYLFIIRLYGKFLKLRREKICILSALLFLLIKDNVFIMISFQQNFTINCQKTVLFTIDETFQKYDSLF